MSRIISLQPAAFVDDLYDDHQGGTFEGTRLPYPFHVTEGGEVTRQDVWGGKPERVIGFVRDLAARRIDLWWLDFVAGDPQAAVGMYVVTQDADGTWGTHLTSIDSVEVHDVPRTGG